jgi:hypothetical protein
MASHIWVTFIFYGDACEKSYKTVGTQTINQQN